MSKFIEHAEKEFLLAGYPPLSSELEDGPEKWLQQDTYTLLEFLGSQGHTQASLGLLLSVFNQLVKGLPLTPLEGVGDEWSPSESGDPDMTVHVNNRCGRVLKLQHKDEEPEFVDLEGILYMTPSGDLHRTQQSVVHITFPYSPKTEIVRVPQESVAVTEDTKE